MIVKTNKLKINMRFAHIAATPTPRPFLDRLSRRPYHIIHKCHSKVSKCTHLSIGKAKFGYNSMTRITNTILSLSIPNPQYKIYLNGRLTLTLTLITPNRPSHSVSWNYNPKCTKNRILLHREQVWYIHVRYKYS